IEEMIIKGEFENIKEIMEKSENLGMRTFDSALYHLYKDGRISLDEALRNADSANNLRLRIKLDQGEGAISGGAELSVAELDEANDESPDANDSKPKSSGLSLSLEEIEEDKDDEDNPFPDL
ncbi:MAG: type IV pili twitching motility protein PilT, partial [Pseudomonadota bacterium]|nr:type IV pili twitching motility protein PilT [Pseudomonadota bacterium]